MNEYKKLTLDLLEKKFEVAKNKKEEYKKHLLQMSLIEQKNVCLFGTGHIGQRAYRLFKEKGYKVNFFCDNNSEKWNQIIVDNIKCISPKDLPNIENVLVIISLNDVDKVYNQLIHLGITDICRHLCEYFSENQNQIFKLNKKEIINQIAKVFEILADEQSKKILYYKIYGILADIDELKKFSYADVYTSKIYCPDDIIKLQDNEIMVDCGAFTGDTLTYFFKEIGYSKFNKYICFELNAFNCEKMKERIDSLPSDIAKKIEIYNYGVSDQIKTIYYEDDTNATTLKITGSLEGKLTTLDYRIFDEKVTYIKMDIEGSEISALNGAKEIIYKNKPKLAICLYHQITDLWEIPLLIYEINPDYKIYIRHHAFMQNETVCYAVME